MRSTPSELSFSEPFQQIPVLVDNVPKILGELYLVCCFTFEFPQVFQNNLQRVSGILSRTLCISDFISFVVIESNLAYFLRNSL